MKKKTATRGILQAPYPSQDGGMNYPIKWENGDGPATVRGQGRAYAEGRMVSLHNGQVVGSDGVILG